MQKLKLEVKQKIMNAGILRFKNDGFENTSMKDIAADAGISIGNIYRYFLTKKHLLNEILEEMETEIEETFESLPSDYEQINIHEIYTMISDLTIKIATEKNDILKVMFHSQNESTFLAFQEKILGVFTQKMMTIANSMKGKKKMRPILCEAIARAEFEGFTCIVKNDIDDIPKLKEDLAIYEILMMENLGERVLEVMKENG